ncbi:cation diffusion facilitator family transporter [Methylovirgula sp. HY1]|uniref:cation diffusion facilitator family transporter n=1 Tax=Methylovirgula sp. HY1 TaxID=2822761 RepID=UPI001C73F44C|nr:cation diffusion facilitator family transporter [Methylovirgula sp. HY1]QXX73528.1 Ferrous-iron efflux pump FieF [Methylovirgula sp. HY1]
MTPTDAHQSKQRVALASIGASAALTLAKLVAGVLSGSLALLSEAGHNLVDTGITIVTFFAVRVAGKPADAEHPYGHGKVESVAALIETGFLFALSTYILAEAIQRLTVKPVEIHANALAVGVLVVSILVDLSRWFTLSRVAKATKSDALAADVLHFSSDIIGSALALAGLVAASLGYPQGDAVAALAVAMFIAVVGYRLGRRTFDTLIDTAPKGLTEDVRAIAERIPGVNAVDQLRLRPAGADVIGDINISVPRTLPLEKVAMIKEAVRTAVAAVHPEVALTVTTQPIALDDESVRECLLLIGARRHRTIHNIIVQEVDGRMSVGFDIEIDGQMRLGQAHEIASMIEADARTELGPDIEVDSHIEPLEPRELPGQDAPVATRNAIAAALSEFASAPIVDVHSVRVRETPAGLVVNYHCRADPDLSVDKVHLAVDELERKVTAGFPAILRIIGHAEPLRRAVIRRHG